MRAKELETLAVTELPARRSSAIARPGCEALAMLVRRGFRPIVARQDIPLAPDLEAGAADQLSRLLDHYAFRLFLRGAIQKSESFAPRETTRYLKASQAKEYAQALVRLGIAEKLACGRYRLLRTAHTFGGTLEWYVGRELSRRYAMDVASGVKLQSPGLGGDFDVLAAAEGKLIYLELKSSPPKNLSTAEVSAFLDRLHLLRPDLGLFVVDTALRLSDKILPMFLAEADRRRAGAAEMPRRIKSEVWALTPYLYVTNGRRDLMANIALAIAEGLRAHAPAPF